MAADKQRDVWEELRAAREELRALLEEVRAMPAEAVVPYETLVRFGVARRRLNEVWCELAKLDEKLARWICEQLNLSGLSAEESDRVCAEFLATVDARCEEASGDA